MTLILINMELLFITCHWAQSARLVLIPTILYVFESPVYNIESWFYYLQKLNKSVDQTNNDEK